MNREEAIQYLIDVGISPEHTMEIVESLNQEPCDAVSRKAAIDAYKKDSGKWKCVDCYKCIRNYDGKRKTVCEKIEDKKKERQEVDE